MSVASPVKMSEQRASMSRNAMGADGADVGGVDGSRVFMWSTASMGGCVDGVGVWIW